MQGRRGCAPQALSCRAERSGPGVVVSRTGDECATSERGRAGRGRCHLCAHQQWEPCDVSCLRFWPGAAPGCGRISGALRAPRVLPCDASPCPRCPIAAPHPHSSVSTMAFCQLKLRAERGPQNPPPQAPEVWVLPRVSLVAPCCPQVQTRTGVSSPACCLAHIGWPQPGPHISCPHC